MILSEQARSMRKRLQTDRLAAKETAADTGDYESYCAFYASQGLQVAKAEQNARISQARQLVRSTRDAIGEARVSGINILGAMAAHTTAKITLDALTKEKQAMFGKASAFGLSGGEA